MKWILSLALMFPLGGQIPMGGITGVGTTCVQPSGTRTRWTAWDAGNVCNGGTCGATFNQITTLHDSGSAGNNFSPRGGTLTGAPLWDGTNTLNSLPTMLLGNPNTTDMASGTGFPTGGTFTWWAMVKPTTTCNTTNCTIMASNNQAGADWNVHATASKLSLDNPYVANASATSTTAMSTSAFKTIVVEFNYTGGAISYYVCSGGTCSADGTATVSTSNLHVSSDFGSLGGIQPFVGNIAEFGYINSISSANRTAIAAWSLCKYGI